MRLLKLRVKNIASLKGEHTISFEDIAAHSNLFAITGETGAGKSTILNSVGLALYGDIFKKTLNQIDVVSLGEYEGMIELIFQVRGKKYLAYWYVRTRKPNGEAYAKVPTPSRYLYTLAGNDYSSYVGLAPR
jgi:exonuclease SbcC